MIDQTKFEKFEFLGYDGEPTKLDSVIKRFTVEQRYYGIVADAAAFLVGSQDTYRKEQEILKALDGPAERPVASTSKTLYTPEQIEAMFAQASEMKTPSDIKPAMEETKFPIPVVVAGVRLDVVIAKATIRILVKSPIHRRLFTASKNSAALNGYVLRGGNLPKDSNVDETFIQSIDGKKRITIRARNYSVTVVVENIPRCEWSTVEETLKLIGDPLAKRFESITFHYYPRLRNDEMEAFTFVMMTSRYVQYVHPNRRLIDDDRICRNKQFLMWNRIAKIVGADRPYFKCMVRCLVESDYLTNVLNELVGTAIRDKEPLSSLFEDNNVHRRTNQQQRSKLTLDSLRTVPLIFDENYSKIVQQPAQPIRFASREDFIKAMEREFETSMDRIIEFEICRINGCKATHKPHIVSITVDDFLIEFPPEAPSLYGCKPLNAKLHHLCYPTIKRKRLLNGMRTIGCLMRPRRVQLPRHVTTYIVSASKRLELNQNGHAEEYLSSVCDMARVALAINHLCSILVEPRTLTDCIKDTLPMWSESSRTRLEADILLGKWKERWALVERIFVTSIAFVYDVQSYNSKLVDVEAHPSDYDRYAMVKFTDDGLVEVYHISSSVIHKQGPIVDFLKFLQTE